MKLLTALFLFASSLAAPLLAADTYTLVFNRKVEAGQRFGYEGKALIDEENNVTLDGAPARNARKSATCTLAGEMEIVAVHPGGEPKEVLLKVTRSEATEDGQPASLFKAGDKIHLTHGDARMSAEVQDQAATPLQTKLLDTLNLLSSGRPQKDDAIFGPGHPVKAGEEWPVNAAVAAADPEIRKVAEFAEKDIQGTVRCVGPVQHGGTPCVKTIAEMKMSTNKGAVPGAPAPVKLRELTATATGEADLSLAPQGARPWDTLDMTIKIEAGGEIERDGAKHTIELRAHIRRQYERRLTPLK
jgi:hypothetical protein